MSTSSEAARSLVIHLGEIGLYGLVIFGGVLAFGWLFRHKASPVLRFSLWFLLLLRLTVPVTLNSAIHMIVLPGQKAGTFPVADQGEGEASPLLKAENPTPLPREGRTFGTAAPATTALAEQATTPKWFSLWRWMVLIWALGAGGMLFHRVWAWVQLQTRLRQLAHTPSQQVLCEYGDLCREMHIRRPVQILAVEDITSPALSLGPWPKVLLPSFLEEKELHRERRFALIHELTHLKRGDHLAMLWYGLVRCIWWFHPVVYAMERPFRLDMESACDSQAVKGMGREEKLAYAALLLELSKESTEPL